MANYNIKLTCIELITAKRYWNTGDFSWIDINPRSQVTPNKGIRITAVLNAALRIDHNKLPLINWSFRLLSSRGIGQDQEPFNRLLTGQKMLEKHASSYVRRLKKKPCFHMIFPIVVNLWDDRNWQLSPWLTFFIAWTHPRGVPPKMTYTWRLHPKGGTYFSLRYMKG